MVTAETFGQRLAVMIVVIYMIFWAYSFASSMGWVPPLSSLVK
jgi:hypothetical protein